MVMKKLDVKKKKEIPFMKSTACSLTDKLDNINEKLYHQ